MYDDDQNLSGSTPAAWHARTRMVHGGIDRSAHRETCEALFLTSGFTYDCAKDAELRFADKQAGFMYSRVGNPTVRMLEERMALIEGAEDCAATATGMAAVHAGLMAQLRTGSRVVSSRLLFGSCHYIVSELMPRFGISIEMVDGGDLSAWEEALAKPADLVFFETPGNPTLAMVDIAEVSRMAHAAGATVVIDNVFATPVLQKPLSLGADMVIYSGTKHIDGQGRCLGGLILCDRQMRWDTLQPYLKNTGPSLSPFNAWMLLKGLETLDIRVAEHVRNAAALADWLAEQSSVTRVLYPGRSDFPQAALAERQMSNGGPLIAFYTGRNRDETFALLDRLKLISISNNLGDAKSLATHPASTTHSRIAEDERQALGITDDLIRLSVGIEDVRDLKADLKQALEA